MRAPALVLVYHRIAAAGPEGADLAVAPARFTEHLEVLRRRAAVVPLARIRDRARGVPQVAITFDDGYLDNVDVAAPMLVEGGMPATFFVTGWSLAGGREFWWDELEHLLGPDSPDPADPVFETVLAGRRLRVDLGDRDARARAATAITTRSYDAEPDDIRATVDALSAHLGVELAVCDAHRHALESGIARLAGLPGVTIGAHSVRHANLTVLSASDRDLELRDAKRRLEGITQRPVTEFAFPFGHAGSFDDASERAVAAAGYVLACRNVRGLVTRRTDPFRIPRFAVRDWTGEEFEARLVRWCSGRW
jgi:peptidoglycan/xylan/chitin deacetylase (PgdA/CDA1 family)